MDKRQIRKQGCVGASEERAHDSDVTDEISELEGLAETPSWRSAAGPHVHAGALGGGKHPSLLTSVVTLSFGHACVCM